MARWRERPGAEVPGWVLDPATPDDLAWAWLDRLEERFGVDGDEWWEAFTVLLSVPRCSGG